MRYGFQFASICTSESWNPLAWEALGSGSPTPDPALPASSLTLSTTSAWFENPSRELRPLGDLEICTLCVPGCRTGLSNLSWNCWWLWPGLYAQNGLDGLTWEYLDLNFSFPPLLSSLSLPSKRSSTGITSESDSSSPHFALILCICAVFFNIMIIYIWMLINMTYHSFFLLFSPRNPRMNSWQN